jgi:hypothetical protein
MSSLSEFFAQNIVLVYFLYGLAFFSMGLAVWLESGRASELRLARAMGPLATFGVMHGVHEWLEMFMRLGEVVPGAPAVGQTVVVEALARGPADAVLPPAHRLWRAPDPPQRSWARQRAHLCHLQRRHAGPRLARQRHVYAAGLRLLRADCLVSIDVLTRYILGIPGAIVAGWAMLLEQRAFRERGLVSSAGT